MGVRKANQKRHNVNKAAGPTYRFTGQYLRISFGLAWVVILAIVFGGLVGSEKADKLADIIVPSMVALIVTLLGIHRAFGSLDYRAKRDETIDMNLK